MPALPELLSILLLIFATQSTLAHLPARLDPARIRSVHRRHHARRAQSDCNDAAVVSGGSPNSQARSTSAASDFAVSFVATGTNATSDAEPGDTGVEPASSSNAADAVGNVVMDLFDDVITPAILKAASMGNGDDVTTSFDLSPSTEYSEGEYIVSPSDMVSSSEQTSSDSGNGGSTQIEANNFAAVAASCNHGDWRCEGMTLKRCNWNEWIVIRECSGENIVCSDQDSTVGCVWTWSVDAQANPQSDSAAFSDSPVHATPTVEPSSAGHTSSVSTSSASESASAVLIAPVLAVVPSQSPSSVSSSQNSAASPTTPPVSSYLASPGTSTVTTSTWINDDGEECSEWEEAVWVTETVTSSASRSTSWSASSYSSALPSPPSIAAVSSTSSSSTSQSASWSSANPGASATAGTDDEDCGEWENESSSESYSSAAGSASQIGNNLAAGPKSSSVSSSSTASRIAAPTSSVSSTSSSVRSTVSSTPTSSAASGASATPAPSSASAGLTTLHAIGATISASNEVLSNLTNPSKTLSVINVSELSISSVSTTKPVTQGVVTATPSAIAGYSAPHYVVYSDMWLHSMPDVSTLGSINRFVLAFWLSDVGPFDNAIMWTWMSQADRQRTLDSYHGAGIALMVSAFGATDQPTTMGKDPLETAQRLAKFVVDYQFDGVDIDYEDMGAMNSDKGEAWLIPFQKELRRLLPRPYLISHAPVAPWFTSSSAYRSGAYVAIHQSVGDGIDFYSMQFYNQGDGVYTSCRTLINESGGYWPGTSVMEMNSYAKVPLEKIVIGKPLLASGASNGYMSPQDLNVCVKQARTQGWNGGVMFWEWANEAPGIMSIAMAK